VQQLANTENQLWITNERYNRLRQENLALWKLLCDAFLPKREAGELLNLVLERQIAEKEKSAQSALKLGVSEHFPAHALTLPASLDAALNSLPLLPTSLLPVTTSASSPLSYPVLSSPLLPSSMVSTEMASTVFSVPALPTSVLPDSPVPVNVVPVSMPAITTQAAPVHAALTLEKTVAPDDGLMTSMAPSLVSSMLDQTNCADESLAPPLNNTLQTNAGLTVVPDTMRPTSGGIATGLITHTDQGSMDWIRVIKGGFDGANEPGEAGVNAQLLVSQLLGQLDGTQNPSGLGSAGLLNDMPVVSTSTANSNTISCAFSTDLSILSPTMTELDTTGLDSTQDHAHPRLDNLIAVTTTHPAASLESGTFALSDENSLALIPPVTDCAHVPNETVVPGYCPPVVLDASRPADLPSNLCSSASLSISRSISPFQKRPRLS